MAGLGYKDFTAGAVLTAAQVDGYLMEQAVMNFAGTAARGSALASVQAAGMVAHVGGGTLTVATSGSAWAQVYPSTAAPGLDYIAGTAFTAGSAISINNCFTSTYANYRIICTAASASGSIGVRLRMRVGGVDASGANTYRQKQIYVAGSSTVTGDYALGTSAGMIECDTDGGGGSLDIYRPNDAVFTFMTGSYDRNTASVFNNHTHVVATAYDGFTIFPNSSTITGTVRVYGYRNS